MTGTAVPAIIVARMRRLKQTFRAAGAVSPATARPPADLGLRKSLVFQKLVRCRILVDAGNGRYYLDEVRDSAMRRRRQTIITLVLFIVLALLLVSLVGWVK